MPKNPPNNAPIPTKQRIADWILYKFFKLLHFFHKFFYSII
jgi:hypothetical protein